MSAALSNRKVRKTHLKVAYQMFYDLLSHDRMHVLAKQQQNPNKTGKNLTFSAQVTH